jgi:diacylglycerol O-acyltransferase
VCYCVAIDFGLMACRDTIPDIEKIAEYIDAAMDGIKGGIYLQNLMQNKDNASL